jgi:tetratricopeptide (TPR) repeat protein
VGKALAYCRQAGEKALARSAHREAVGSSEQALSILLQLPEQRDTRAQAIDLRLTLRSALHLSGDYGRILALLREAEALAEALDDPRRLEQVSRFLSVQFYFRGAHTQAIAAAQRALDLATTSGYSALKAMANQSLGFVYHSQGDYRRAIDCFGQVIPFFEGAWHRECFGLPILSTVFPRAFLAICHAELGTFAAGRDLGEAGCRIAETADLPGSLMVASWGVGLWASRQGDLSRALPLLERAVGICQDLDLLFFFPRVATALGALYTLPGAAPTPWRCSRRRYNRARARN